jgi:hypothetical protein
MDAKPFDPDAGCRCGSCLERRGYVEQAEVWQARAAQAEARVAELEGALRRLWAAVVAYGRIGFEGSELLEATSAARVALPPGSADHA